MAIIEGRRREPSHQVRHVLTTQLRRGHRYLHAVYDHYHWIEPSAILIMDYWIGADEPSRELANHTTDSLSTSPSDDGARWRRTLK